MPLPDNVRLRDLERFATVIEAGGFTAAGRVLGETTKQVSRRVALLEEELGLRLLHRTTRSVQATPEGADWYQSARQALDALEAAVVRQSPSAGPQGRVRIQVPTLFVDAAVDWLASLMSDNPRLEVDLIVGDLAEDMLAMGLDLVLTAVPPRNAGVVLKRLGRASPALVAHPSYLERAGTPRVPAELARHECLRFHAERPQTHWPLAHRDGTLIEVAVGGRLACNDSRTLLRALHAGMGIGPESSSDATGLVAVLDGWRLAGIDMYLAVAPGRRKLPRVRVLSDGLEAIARNTLAAVRAAHAS
ncbi:MAG: LysR family transcriptional regulator [Proteobacteria bacterium]|nr:LysR family transcriptional regulator [Pseudomonadota bacterium]